MADGGGGRDGRLRPLLALAGLLAVVVAVGVVAGSGTRSQLQVDPRADGTSTAVPVTAGPVPVAPPPPTALPAVWSAMPDAGIPARTRHTATWTGTELLVYGGQPDPGEAVAARYDPARRRWRPMAVPPTGSRVGHTAVWTGRELIVFEGGTVGQAAAASAQGIDGAAYDPTTDTWREIARAPVNPRSGHVAVWTGEEMLVFGGSRTFERRAQAALYDPEADSWRLSSPAPIERAFGLTAAVWTGEEVVIWTGQGEEDVAAYDPATDTWRRLPGAPVAMRSAAAVWTGEEVLLLGRTADGPDVTGGAALDVAQGRWTVLPPSPRVEGVTPAAVWTGEAAIVVGGPPGQPGAAWSPASNRWVPLPPGPHPAIAGHSATWVGDRVVVWGGQGPRSPLGTGAELVLRPGG